MTTMHPRLEREAKTIEAMVALYCRQQHSPAGPELCADCAALLEYARERLRLCPFQEKKSTCAKCTVHCYRPVMRESVRRMMRYAGPRMLLHHPVMAALHLLDGLRKPPVLERKTKPIHKEKIR